jgi:hypothetical protein
VKKARLSWSDFFFLFQNFKFQSYIILASCRIWITELSYVRNCLFTNITKFTWLYIKWCSSCKSDGYLHFDLLAVFIFILKHSPKYKGEKKRWSTDSQEFWCSLEPTACPLLTRSYGTIMMKHNACTYVQIPTGLVSEHTSRHFYAIARTEWT